MQTLKYVIGADRRALVKDVQDFKIDFSGVKNWLQARQYEDGMRQVFVDVTNEDGTPFDLTGCNVMFEGLLPDGTHRIMDAKHSVIIDPTNGQFRFDFPKQAFSLAGSYKQAFFRIMRDGSSVTTLEFSLEVLADKVISGIVPSDYLTPFEDLYAKLSDILANADGEVKTKIQEWQTQINQLITNLNGDYASIQLLVTGLQSQLDDIAQKIKDGNIVTVKDLNDWKEENQDKIDELAAQTASVQVDYPGSDQVEPIFKDEIQRVLTLIDGSKFNLAVNVDAHYQHRTTSGGRFLNYPGISDLSNRHIPNLLALGSKCDAALMGGDNIHPDYINIDVGKKDMQVQSNMVLNANVPADRFMILGNHDVGDSLELFTDNKKAPLADVINESEVKKYYHTYDCEMGEIRNGDSLYFYKDYPDKKVRLICVETEDTHELTDADGNLKYPRISFHVIAQEQMNWIANVALMSVPVGYHVVMFGHAPLETDHVDSSVLVGVGGTWNNDALADIINAYKQAQSITIKNDAMPDYPIDVTADFSSREPGIFVGFFGGHYHRETMTDFHNFKVTGLLNSVCENSASKVTREVETVTEDAETVISVDTTNRSVKLIGFGAATSREFTY